MQVEANHNLFSQATTSDKMLEYDDNTGVVAAHTIHKMNVAIRDAKVCASHGQQHLINKALKVFGDKGREAAKSEMEQLHDRACFAPVLVNSMTARERQRAQKALMFVTEKRDGRIKGRMVYDGSGTRDFVA